MGFCFCFNCVLSLTVCSVLDAFAAALQATLTANESSEDGFGNPAFVGFLFFVILVLFPIGLGLLLLVKKNIIPN